LTGVRRESEVDGEIVKKITEGPLAFRDLRTRRIGPAMEQNILISFGGYGLFLLLGMFLMMIPVTVGAILRPFVATKQKREVYECGEPTIGSSWIRYNIRFYSTALDFLIFDVEVVLLLPVAVALVPIAKAIGVAATIPIFFAFMVFFFMLALGLAYAWRWGSVDWVMSGVEDQPKPLGHVPAPPTSKAPIADNLADAA